MIGGIVYIKAVDWGVHSEQVDCDYPASMPIVVGELVGFIVDENDERVVIAQQVFADGGMRALLSIPRVCIRELISVKG